MDEISIYLPGILLAYSAFLLAIASPGPNVLAVIGTSMSIGRPQGMALALGVAAGSLCWALATAGGLSALLASYASALVLIKLAGGLYLLWLSYKAFRSAASLRDLEVSALDEPSRHLLRFARRGFAIQMTNPKAALAWIAIISLGLKENAPLWVALSIVIGTAILSVIIHCVYAVAFSTPVMVRLYSRARRWIQAALGAFFAFAGLRLLTARL
ncbi:MAG: LysE family translocator [Hyphomicrobiales bacterium]|nr:LysE family translocator [Hyphomicrobiales bacterium]MBV9434055.1 LysE family translocator [Hyphomicrobiales bacterium]MBV9741409.1 LysE family translocator [Hyphomicrobiales bacterium]